MRLCRLHPARAPLGCLCRVACSPGKWGDGRGLLSEPQHERPDHPVCLQPASGTLWFPRSLLLLEAEHGGPAGKTGEKAGGDLGLMPGGSVTTARASSHSCWVQWLLGGRQGRTLCPHLRSEQQGAARGRWQAAQQTRAGRGSGSPGAGPGASGSQCRRLSPRRGPPGQGAVGTLSSSSVSAGRAQHPHLTDEATEAPSPARTSQQPPCAGSPTGFHLDAGEGGESEPRGVGTRPGCGNLRRAERGSLARQGERPPGPRPSGAGRWAGAFSQDRARGAVPGRVGVGAEGWQRLGLADGRTKGAGGASLLPLPPGRSLPHPPRPPSHPVSCSSKPPGERLLPIGRRRLLRPELSASNRPQLVASPWTGGRRVLAKALGTRFLSSPSPSWTLLGRVIPEAPVTVGLAPGRGWLPICPFSARMHLSPQCSMGAAAAGLPPPGSPPHMPPSCADPPHGPPAGCRVLYEPLLQSREEGALHGLRQPPSSVAGACCTARPEQWGARAGL